MKAAAVVLAISPVVVSAIASGGPPAGVPVNCAKANANYCLGGDIILRCDADSVGIQGRCSDNVAGYPPFGGIASCQQSSELAGDGACVKNCVVYAAKPYTLPAHKCTPSHTATESHTGTPTGPATTPEETNSRTASNSATGTKPMATDTGIMSIPEGTSFEMPSATTHANHTTWTFTNPSRNSSMTTSHTKTDKRPIETDTDTDTASSQPTTTATVTSTGAGAGAGTGTGTGTGTSTPTSTAAANVNQAAGALAAAGFVAALFL
ncbi:hypothetical protein E4U32_000766 [Claviceps aff. humidiphila group G2b]|nr:hypothetical protein E4U32_000766 [Claviceps aff. humidiphila group G2b]